MSLLRKQTNERTGMFRAITCPSTTGSSRKVENLHGQHVAGLLPENIYE